MPETIADTVADIHQSLLWLPKWLPGLLLLLFAALVATVLYNTVLRFLMRLSGRSALVQKVLNRTRVPNRAALVVIALGLVLPATGFPFAVMTLIGHILAAAIIAMLGWDALIAVVVGSELYVHRLPIDAEDNLIARKQVTQVIMLRRTVNTLIIIITVTAALMTFPAVRRYGVDFLVSAGAAGLILGLAARPLFSNLIAGVQIAITQPFRIDDEVVIQGETGRIERIAGTYVVVRIWDGRRLIDRPSANLPPQRRRVHAPLSPACAATWLP
jgi:small-conductance mechanosensitive channel